MQWLMTDGSMQLTTVPANVWQQHGMRLLLSGLCWESIQVGKSYARKQGYIEDRNIPS